MITLFCDLDNTIIFSHRKELNTSKRVAEMLNGVEQSYITQRTFDYLSSCRAISFVPVTTRTKQQYERVRHTIDSFNCKYALILNGAILLTDGNVDSEWCNESKRIAKESAADMERAAKLLMQYLGVPLVYCDDYLIYTSVQEPQAIAEMLRGDMGTSQINIFYDNRKVYCAPISMSKGKNISRFKKRFEAGITIGAGDSETDISMLENVDLPILPQPLTSLVSNPNKIVVPNTRILSDVACDEIERVINSHQ